MNSGAAVFQIAVLASCLTLQADEKNRTLFAFRGPDAARTWQSVNDGVMGGRSDGRFRINSDSHLEFSGTLSLANNGGFASIRATGTELGVRPGETIVARVRGDGREYNLNLYMQKSLSRYSFRQSFRTTPNQWIEVCLPVDNFVATFRGRQYPQQKLIPQQADGLGILLGDKRPGPFKLEVAWIRVEATDLTATFADVSCEGAYPHHLQGICVSANSIYWSFTTQLVKTDVSGALQKQIPVANHHGDLCFYDDKLYVAVNLGKFNDPTGNADSWVYVYDADTLKELARHETQQVFHGAGGIGVRDDHFFVVGGLPDAIEENYVYEYDGAFKFLRKHTIDSGHTHLGIQTATFSNNQWVFGCYGTPQILLTTDSDFKLLGRHQFDCSLGIVGLPNGSLLSASGECNNNRGCIGRARIADLDDKMGLIIRHTSTENNEDE